MLFSVFLKRVMLGKEMLMSIFWADQVKLSKGICCANVLYEREALEHHCEEGDTESMEIRSCDLILMN